MKSLSVPWKKIIYFMFLILSIAAGAYLIFPGVLKIVKLTQDEMALDKNLGEKENKKSRLQKYLDKLKTDAFMAEKIARDEMGLSKDNEMIYKFDR